MELEDSGQHHHFLNDDFHSCNEADRSTDLWKRMSTVRISPEATFSRIQMIFKKRRRGGGEDENSCRDNPHQSSPHNHTRRKYNHPLSSSPLVLLTTSLIFFLCLFPLHLVHPLPFDSRSSSLGDGGSYRSQMDLLIDPIHQAEFGDEEPLESKRVVAKSVFDMVLRTPAPPTSSSNKCPPGTQSPFEGGPCIKKSTDPIAFVDQSFLLDTLRGLAKEGMLLSTGPTKTRKRRPTRPGGSSRTTPSPTSTTQATTTSTVISTTMPTLEDSTPIMEEVTQEAMSLANSNIQPVFEEETTKLLETVPSTLPTTITPVEEVETRGTANVDSESKMTTSPTPTPPKSQPLPNSGSNDNDEQIVKITTSPLEELPTSLLETTIAVPTESLSSEQEKSDQENQNEQQNYHEIEGEPLIISTTPFALQNMKGVDDIGSQISPETTVDDASASSTRQTFPQSELLTTSEDGADMTTTDKDDVKIQPTTSTSPSPSSSLVFADIDTNPNGAGEEMTGAPTSPDFASLELADEGEKRGDIPAALSGEQQSDKLLTTRMIQDPAGEKDHILIYNDNPKEELPLAKALSSEVEEEKTISDPTTVTLNDDDDADHPEDRNTEQSPQEPIIIINKSIPEVESKREEEPEGPSPTHTNQEQVEPSSPEGADLINLKEQVEGLMEDARKGIMMMMGEGDSSMTGIEEKKGVNEEEQAEPEVGDRQPSPISPVVNHRTESTPEQLVSEEGKGTVMMMTTASTPPEKIADMADDDLLIINNSEISPSHDHYQVNKDGEGTERTTPSIGNEKDVDDGKSSSSREDFTILAREQNANPPELIPASTLSPPEVAPTTTLSSSPFQPSLRPKDKDSDSTLLQFQLPIVTNGPNHVENSREGGGDVGGFEKFPEFPAPSGRIRFPSTSGILEVPVEGGGVITGETRGTQRPIYVKDFQLEYPPLRSQEPLQQQQWQSPKPFLIPPSAVPARLDQTTQPDYESGSTEYLESELDRRHQKTRSRNRIRTPEQQLPSSTSQPLPLELSSFYPGNSYPYQNRHQLPSSPPSQNQRRPSSQPPESQQPFFFARRNGNPSTEFGSFGYPNFRPGHDRFHHNTRRLIW